MFRSHFLTAAATAAVTLGTAALAQGYYAPPAQVYRQPMPHYQPYMVDALQALQHARGNLQSASADKGGHRERAIGLIDQAINETMAGINYANTHDS